MLKTEGQKFLPRFIPGGEEVYAVVGGIGKFGVTKKEAKIRGFEGKPCYQINIQLDVLDGEYAGMTVEDNLWFGIDNGVVFGAGKLQGLMTATGCVCGQNDRGENLYPWPEDQDEIEALLNNKGIYEIEGLGLRGRLVKIQTAEPYVNKKTRSDGSEVTYTNTVVDAYRTPDAALAVDLKPLVDLWSVNNPF